MKESVEAFLVRLIDGTICSNYKFSKLRGILKKVSVILREMHLNSVLAKFEALIQLTRIVTALRVELAHKYQPKYFSKRLKNTNVGTTREIHAKTHSNSHESRSIVLLHPKKKSVPSRKHIRPHSQPLVS